MVDTPNFKITSNHRRDRTGMYINTLRHNGKTHAVTIPPALMASLGWNRGDLLILEPGPDGTVIIHAEKKLQEFLRERAKLFRTAQQNDATGS